ncbi:MAG: hypothetical protein R2681_04765 [Pyrinomonadaceae bacterium]
MKKYPFTVLSIILFQLVAFAQAKEDPCLKIQVIEPVVAVNPGEILSYQVSIPDELNISGLEYQWSVDQGKIVEGQGTSGIKVLTEGLIATSVTAKVMVLNLPKNCAAEYSGSGTIAHMPKGHPPDEFGKLTERAVLQWLDPFAFGLRDAPGSTGWIINFGPEDLVHARERLIAFYLSQEREIDLSRIVFAYIGSEPSIRTRLWIVPSDTNTNECKDCQITKGTDIKFNADEISSRLEQPSCPTISVLEPAVAVLPGENQTFTAYVAGEVDLDKIGYNWTVTYGKLIKGQGTPTLIVIPEDRGSYTLATVTVEITGLPDKCVCTTASGSSITAIDRIPVLRNEFGVLSESELRIRLEPYVKELLADPNTTGYVVIYGRAGDVKKREKFIQKFMIKRGDIEASRIVFVHRGEEKTIRTRLWVVPAGADTSSVD